MYSGHTVGTVIDRTFLETVRQIVVHERFFIFGAISAVCFLIATWMVFLPDFAEVRRERIKWVAICCWIFGICVFLHLLTDTLPILSAKVTVECEYEISDRPQSERNDKQPLLNSSDRLVNAVDKETRTGEEQPFYMIYCNGKVIRKYDIVNFSLREDVQ